MLNTNDSMVCDCVFIDCIKTSVVMSTQWNPSVLIHIWHTKLTNEKERKQCTQSEGGKAGEIQTSW